MTNFILSNGFSLTGKVYNRFRYKKSVVCVDMFWEKLYYSHNRTQRTLHEKYEKIIQMVQVYDVKLHLPVHEILYI